MGELVFSDHGRAVQFLRSFDCSPALEGHGDNKVVICIDSTDSMIVAGYGNNVVDRQRPYYHMTQCHQRCGEGTEGTTCLKKDTASNTLYSGACDHFIGSWDLKTGVNKAFEQNHVWSSLNFIVCRDIDRIVLGGNDGTTRVWNMRVLKCGRLLIV